jgi:hypothetical protein
VLDVDSLTMTAPSGLTSFNTSKHSLGTEGHGPVSRWLRPQPWHGQRSLGRRDGFGQLAQHDLWISDNGISDGGARGFGGIASDGDELRTFGQIVAG